jgi:hypothetical protein
MLGGMLVSECWAEAMKRKGQHVHNALTPMLVRKLNEPGFYADGNGLYLKVDKTGAKRWVQRIVINGKRSDLGLGSPLSHSKRRESVP